ncbi:hypothetical protein ACTPEO_12545 [Clostridioides difficile]
MMWVSAYLSNDTKEFNEYWNIKIPSPSEEKVVLISEESFLGDGESFIIYKYSDTKFDKIKNLHIGKSIDDKNINNINEQIKNFKSKILTLNDVKDDSNRRKHIEEAFGNYPIKTCVSDNYLHIKKEDGSELLLIVRNDERKIYILQIIM